MMIQEDAIETFDAAARKVVLITGATGRIGREIARALAAPGWTLALQYLSRESEARELARTVEAAGAVALPIQGDIATETGCGRLVASLQESAGAIEVLVHAAAPKIQPAYPLDAAEDNCDRELQLHVAVFLRICRLMLPAMLARQRGLIVPLLSTVIEAARPKKWTPYTTAKFALTGAAAGLATDLTDTGIRVVGLLLGRLAERETPPSPALVEPAQVGALVRRIVEDPANFPHGQTARLVGRKISVGSIAFQGKEISI